MNKIKVRCFKAYAVGNGVHNIELFITLPGFGYGKKLYSCSNCSDIFVLDLDDPKLHGSKEIPSNFNEKCPSCNLNLKDTLLKYPDYIVISKGNIVKIDNSSIKIHDNEGIIKDFWLVN
jgi:hypothetical protein